MSTGLCVTAMYEDERLKMRPCIRLCRIDSELSKLQSDTFFQETGRSPSQDESSGSLPTERRCEIINHIDGKVQVNSEKAATNDGTTVRLPTEVNHASPETETQQPTAASLGEDLNEASAPGCTTEKLTPKQKATREQHNSGQHKAQDAEMQCTLCNKTYANYKSLCRHKRRIHFKNYKYNCEDCEQRFIARYKYVEHRRRHHTFEKPYQCDICKKRYFTRERARCHMMIHTEFKPVTCKRCGQLFALNGHLKTHLKECKVKRNARGISKSTIPLVGMDPDLSVHTSEESSALEKSLLKDKSKNRNKRIAPQNSQNCTPSKSLSLEHNAMPRGSENEQRPSVLTQQDQSLSGGHDGVSLVGDDQSAEHSEIAPNNDGTSIRLPREVNHSSPNSETQQPTAVSLGGDLNEASAPECTTEKLTDGNESFNLGQIARSSRSKRHAPSLVRPSDILSKEIRELSFAADHTTANINQTVQTPKEKATRRQRKSSKPINENLESQCTLCNKTFANYKSLCRHKRHVHLKNYKYNCEDCDQRFIARCKYVEHRRHYHTFEKPFQCDICKECYCTRQEIRCHMMEHTGFKPVTCKRCGQLFALNGHLKTHLKECKGKRNARAVNHASPKAETQQPTAVSLGEDLCEASAPDCTTEKLSDGNESFNLGQIGRSSRNKRQTPSLVRPSDSLSKETRELSFASDHATANINQTVQSQTETATREQPNSGQIKTQNAETHCTLCNKTFANYKSLYTHKRCMHVKNYKYNCEDCEQRFIVRYKYVEHRRRYHTHEKPYQCDICKKRYCIRQGARCHMKKHTGINPVICKICGKLFALNSNLETHLKECEAKRSAGEISKSAVPLISMDHDLSVHTPEGLEKSLLKEKTKHRNKMIAQQDKSLSGGHDGVSFVGVSNENGDIKPTCLICSKTYVKSSNLQRHMRDMHFIFDSKYNCEVCGEHFQARHKYLEHCMTSHQKDCKNERISNEISSTFASQDESVHNNKRFQCEVCSMLLTSAAGLRKHKKHIHDRDYDRKYICEFCGQRFCVMLKCLNHIRTCHTEEKPYLCQLCQKSFHSAKSLKIHQHFSHNDHKPHKCAVCGKGFISVGSLKAHLLRHSGEAPYSCAICESRFTRKSELKCHRKLLKMLRSCNNCTKLFCTSHSLNQHLKICHPVPPKPVLMKKENVHNKTEEGFQEKGANIPCEENDLEVENHGNQLELENQTIQAGKETGHVQVQMDEVDEILLGNGQTQDSQSVSNQCNIKPLMCKNCGKTFSSLHTFSRHHNNRACSALLELKSNKAQNVDQHLLLSLQQHRYSEETQKIVSDTMSNKVIKFAQSKRTSIGLQPEGNMQIICDLCGKVCASKSSRYHHRKQVHLKNFNYKHVCKFCGKRFYKIVPYRSHVYTHTGERPFKCDICQKTFTSKKSLRTHMLRHQERVVCPICNVSYSTKYGYKTHVRRVHLNGELFTCDICHMIKRNKTSLRIHMRSHTQEKKEFQCERCSKWFVSSESRKKHMNKACPVGGCYICRDCMKPCATKKILRWHMEQTHKEPMLKRQFACNICNRRFVNKYSLPEHILTHGTEKPFLCSNCPKTFFTQHRLKVHMISHQQQKHFTCSECSKVFKYSNSLSLHKRKYCHASGNYLCRDCPSKFATREALLSHFEREQISNGTPKNKILQPIEKLYKCDVCLKSFANKQVLVTHMDSHAGKQFKCKNCSKLFTYFSGLWIHMKKYCRDCPSKLETREALLSHFEREQISNGTPKIEKLYKCDVCLKSFANKQVLGTHMDSHAGKQFKCKNCSKLFTYYSGLWIHMKKYCKSNKL